MAKAIAFLVLLLISPAAYAATSHTVGDDNGWTTGVDYVAWSSSQTFTVDDTLVFNYDSSHNVDEVNEADYTNCNTDNPISSFPSSPTTISLTAPGTRYFICPRSNHCSRGVKLAVNVTAGSNSSDSSSQPADTTTTLPATKDTKSNTKDTSGCFLFC